MRRAIAVLLAGLLGLGGPVACAAGPKRAALSGPGKIGVILPDSKSSTRWESADRVYLREALTEAGVPFVIQNAQGDRTAFRTIAEQMIADGVTVLMIVSLDPASGKAVLD